MNVDDLEEFVAVDSSARQVELGEAVAAELADRPPLQHPSPEQAEAMRRYLEGEHD